MQEYNGELFLSDDELIMFLRDIITMHSIHYEKNVSIAEIADMYGSTEEEFKNLLDPEKLKLLKDYVFRGIPFPER